MWSNTHTTLLPGGGGAGRPASVYVYSSTFRRTRQCRPYVLYHIINIILYHSVYSSTGTDSGVNLNEHNQRVRCCCSSTHCVVAPCFLTPPLLSARIDVFTLHMEATKTNRIMVPYLAKDTLPPPDSARCWLRAVWCAVLVLACFSLCSSTQEAPCIVLPSVSYLILACEASAHSFKSPSSRVAQ